MLRTYHDADGKQAFEDVSSRRSVKMRGLDYWIYWFSSRSNVPPIAPPPIPWPSDKGLRHHDLFLYHKGKETRAWRYISDDVHGAGQWERLVVGRTVPVPELEGERIFVVNKKGKPSYVLQGTVAKLYNSLARK